MKTSDFEKNAMQLQRAAVRDVAGCGKNVVRLARLRALERASYSEKDLRGLSATEKNFLRANQMRAYYCEHTTIGEAARYFVFIGRNATTGKKQLYAYSVRQMLDENGRDINAALHNYKCWLLPRLNKNENAPVFSVFRYEVRPFDRLTDIYI